jgi:membrane protease YdiL (CAAX protease family)
MAANNSVNIKHLKHAISFYAYLLVVWGFYRLLFQAPDPLEEIIVKPIVWVLPLYFLIRSEKASLNSIGIVFNDFFKVIYFVLSLGFIFSIFAVIVNYLKYDGLNFAANLGDITFMGAIGLSFITAVVEEITFRGYLLTRLMGAVKSELTANLVISTGWALIHLPIAVLDWKLEPFSLVVYTAVVFMFSLGTTFVFLRTKNIAAPILLHVLWQWPIILFR